MTENQNPYQSPTYIPDSQASVPDRPDCELARQPCERLNALPGMATRGVRLLAHMIDYSIVFLILTGLFFASPLLEQIFYELLSIRLFAELVVPILRSISDEFAMFLLSTFLFYGFNSVLLATRGQTIGKYFVGIRIVDNNGKKIPFLPLITKRYLLFELIGLIPVIGILINTAGVLLIFRGDRRCAHDLVCNSYVRKVSSTYNSLLPESLSIELQEDELGD